MGMVSSVIVIIYVIVVISVVSHHGAGVFDAP
jgi:hypothetical protein